MKNNLISKTCGFFCGLTALAGIATFSSCENFLDIDKYVYDQITIDSVFVSKERLLQYINGAAAYLPNESNLVTNNNTDGDKYVFSPSGLVTDDAFVPWVDWNHSAMYFMIDQVVPRDTHRFNPWENYYRGIRKTNILLARIPECQELTAP